jgi:hypothetical protein
MRPLSFVAAALLLCGNSLCPAAERSSTAGPYDGEWSVVLVCADTQDRNGLVKGYEYTFHVSIVDGKLHGQYGAEGAPASVVYSGEVGADGMLELRAVGHTGRSDRSVGKVPQGTGYSYTLSGRLEHTHGEASRRELRPCTATFGKL